MENRSQIAINILDSLNSRKENANTLDKNENKVCHSINKKKIKI